MVKIYILYWCDMHHTESSKRVAGIFDSKEKAKKSCHLLSKNSDEGLIKIEDDNMLDSINQTQNRDENYIIEERILNKLIG